MKKLKLILMLIVMNLKILCVEEKEVKNNDNELFKSLRDLINLIDELRDCGINEYIELPRICTLGTQSSGKSSVLESIIGLDFLPRGNGVVTRRPLELRLFNIKSNESWAKFEERNNKIYKDFTEVKQTIEELTSEVCGKGKNIIDKPIVLSVHCKTCPDLTLIDLPGITRVPVEGQPGNIEEITRNMATKYINNPLTIILCVIAANSDIATSDGLKLAKEIDKDGSRTLGILTKLDIMDEGTDVQKTILNEEIELKLGYVGIINRSKKDLDNKLPMEEIAKKEKEFFKTHRIYKYMDQKIFGTEALIKKLTKIYFEKITESLPKIIESINSNVLKIEEELKDLGDPIPENREAKIHILLDMINKYCQIFRDILQGKTIKMKNFLKDEGGFKIRKLYENLLIDYTKDFEATDKYDDSFIDKIISRNEGHSIPGFPSIEAFYELIEPQFEKLKKPIDDCFQKVFQYLTFLSKKIMEKVFKKFPNELDIMNHIMDKYLNKIGNKTQYLIENIFIMETSYLFTNDDNYLKYFTEKYIDKTYEMRIRINEYFKLIVRNLRESVPKIIGKYLVKEIEDNMQTDLSNLICNLNITQNTLLESSNIIERRKHLKNMINIMKNAQKIIFQNKHFINAIKI